VLIKREDDAKFSREHTHLSSSIQLSRQENQARGIGQYAIDFVAGRLGEPDPSVYAKVEQFHRDSIACGVAALACRMNAPLILRKEALTYRTGYTEIGATCLGSVVQVKPEKAVLANCSAVRELDANGTNFGYNPELGHSQGEFGHNDFYPVVIAAAQQVLTSGRDSLRAMICLDEIRGRLAEVFALRRYKIDHVVHGAIASAAVYGAMLKATAEQIELAIGLLVAHFIPFRAIRHGHQLSDSKGASAALSAELAVACIHRTLRGFIGPADIFRNPQAIFCLFEPTKTGESPFDLQLSTTGKDFAVMGMHFKLGLYEHQSAGAIQALFDLLTAHPGLLETPDGLQRIRIAIYEPAFGIICDPAKRDPHNRQSADHSMVYIIARLLRKALESRNAGWRELMLLPKDYDESALADPMTRKLMAKIEIVHGGPEFDAKYPEGIPTRLEIEHARLGKKASGLVMYPLGHARNTGQEFDGVLSEKFRSLASLAVSDPDRLRDRLTDLENRTPQEIQCLYDFAIDHAWIA
jgi:2-methylcitrate dehydratase